MTPGYEACSLPRSHVKSENRRVTVAVGAVGDAADDDDDTRGCEDEDDVTVYTAYALMPSPTFVGFVTSTSAPTSVSARSPGPGAEEEEEEASAVTVSI